MTTRSHPPPPPSLSLCPNFISPVVLGGHHIDVTPRVVMKLDNTRDKYGMKTATMATMFAELNFPQKKGRWYDRLKGYTDPAKNPSPVSEEEGSPVRIQDTLIDNDEVQRRENQAAHASLRAANGRAFVCVFCDFGGRPFASAGSFPSRLGLPFACV